MKKLTIHTTPLGEELLTAALLTAGITQLEIEDPADISAIIEGKDRLAWDYIDDSLLARARKDVTVSYYAETPDKAQIDAIIETLREEFPSADLGTLKVTEEEITDDWKYAYRETFHAFEPIQGLTVAPPWEEPAVGAAAGKTIILDPGMAFGTGSHETTAMCLEQMAAHLPEAMSLLDAGTGSGILAIAAAALAPNLKEITAIEIDPDAAQRAAANIAANGMTQRIELITGDLTKPGTIPDGKRYDIITANLASGIIKTLIPHFAALLNEGGTLILSGLLAEEGDDIIEKIKAAGLRDINQKTKGEWKSIWTRK
jgi:ribosomal protein L11 methyltransferase